MVHLHDAILILGWLDSSSAAADFLVAQKITIALTFLFNAINKSAFPSTSRLLSSDVPQAMHLLSSLLRYYLVLTIPVILVLALYAGEVQIGRPHV